MKHYDVIYAYENVHGLTEYGVWTFQGTEEQCVQQGKVEAERRNDDLTARNMRVIASCRAGYADDVIASLLIGQFR